MLGPGSKDQLKTYAQLGAVGIELSLSTVLGLLGGQWLDDELGTTPLFTVIGLLLGLFAGFRSLIRTAKKAQRRHTDDDTHNDG